MEIFLKVEGSGLSMQAFSRTDAGSVFSAVGWRPGSPEGKSMDEAIEIEADTVLSVFEVTGKNPTVPDWRWKLYTPPFTTG